MLHYLKTWWLANRPKSEKGQDLAEYGLLVALIALIVLIGVTFFGDNLLDFFNQLASEVDSWTP